MNKTRAQLPTTFFRAILATAAAIWGLGFVIGKGAIAEIGATWFTAIRFIGSGFVLLIILFPHFKCHLNRSLVKAGCIIGVFSFLGFWTQFLGLGMTTPSKNAFLSACYCLTVPLIWWVVARRRPSKRICLAAIACTIGIGLVSLSDSFSIGAGDAMSIVSAFAYGTEIVVISLVMKDHDVLSITVVQQFTSGILASVLALATAPIPTAEQIAQPWLLGAMAYVIFLAAAFGSVAQNLAQAHVSASEAGLLCSLESVFCAIFSVTLLNENLTLKMAAGFILIFASIIVAQLSEGKGEQAIQDVSRKHAFEKEKR